jgi:hypothetical protein
MSELRTNFYFEANEGGRTVTSVIVWIVFDFYGKFALIFVELFMI